MGDAHRRIGGVDVLAAGAGGAHRIDADVFGRDVDVDLLGLRQHGDGRRRGVDAAAGLGRRHALHAVHAGFELQLREDALARDGRDDFLVAAGLALARRGDLDLPAAPGGIALVHAEQVAGEQRRLVAAGAGADFEDGVLLVGRVLGQQQDLDVASRSASMRSSQLGQLGLGQRRASRRRSPGRRASPPDRRSPSRPPAVRGSWPTMSCSSEYSDASFT